ncbi:M14 family metallopeptidase [Xanthobacter sp. VNH20]|uniref:succinylglutamate desuccinylase/aspartoacylase family protein n=1 Tax=Xanthobacter sp. VNH20 TaxID=3156616 RepID=UPI0032B57EDE
MSAFVLGSSQIAPGTRALVSLPVTRTLRGDLSIPVHVLAGAAEGPTLAVLCSVHGDENGSLVALKALLDGLDLSTLAGTLLLLPVANPLAFADLRRETSEQRENTDLHRCFPGNARGSITEMIAAVIAREVIARCDALIDIHAGGNGGRIQQRADLNEDATGDVRARSLAMCEAFGTGFVHVNFLPPSTAAGHANKLGIAACAVEVGGTYLPTPLANFYRDMTVRGIEAVMALLGMLERQAAPVPDQHMFGRKARKEANPTRAGYLLSLADEPSDLGRAVQRDELLGTVIDPFTLEAVEELRAPCDGVIFFSRMSGIVDAGAKGYAIAESALMESGH